MIWRWLWVWVILITLGFAPQPAAAQNPTTDLAAYETLVREALIAAQRGDRLGLEEIATRLTPITSVATDAGTARADNAWLSEELSKPDPDFDLISARLGALLDALSAPESAPPADAQAQLQDLLSRPPYAVVEQDDSLIGRFFDWLFRQFLRLLDPLSNVGAGPGNLMAWLFALIGLGLIGWVLFIWLRGMRGGIAKETSNAEDDPDAGLTAKEALQQANNLARDGDYRTGVRYLYLSALLWMDEQGMLRYDRALTNREYLERLSERPNLRDALQPIITTFDRVWYGYAELDAASFAAYEQQVQNLRTLK